MNTKKLKQLVLDLAIHGKLVPQDPNDEPASELLKRIQADVETHGRASNKSKGKKSAVSSVDLDEVPFEVPEGWCWCRLGEISSYGECQSVDVKTINDSEWTLELEDLEKDSARVLSRQTISSRPLKGTRHKFSQGDVLYSKLRTYLNKVLVAKENGYCTTEIIPIKFLEDIDSNFMCHVLRSPYFLDYTMMLGYGVKMPRLSTEDARKAYIPLPPLAEQHRIVAAIEKWFAVIDQLEKNEADLKKSIEQTKKKVLDLAIRGKLVAQNPEDEPAGELLARIRADVETHGRASKSKKSSIPSVDLDEVPFEVPEGWEWCRMNDVCDIINGSTVEKTLEKENGQFAYLRVGDMNLPENKTEIVTSKTYLDNPLNLVPINSFIFPKRGGAILTNKKRSVRKFPIWIDLNLMAVNVIAADLFDYLFMFFSTIDLGKVCNGGNIPQINFSDIAKILVPLPPLAEQKRIVEKINEVFGVLERIEGMM